MQYLRTVARYCFTLPKYTHIEKCTEWKKKYWFLKLWSHSFSLMRMIDVPYLLIIKESTQKDSRILRIKNWFVIILSSTYRRERAEEKERSSQLYSSIQMETSSQIISCPTTLLMLIMPTKNAPSIVELLHQAFLEKLLRKFHHYYLEKTSAILPKPRLISDCCII